jgi:hypothetical protein
MSQYQVLLKLDIKHEYFADGNCRDLVIAPTAETDRLLQGHSLILKQSSSGFYIVADLDRNFKVVESLVLRFEICTRDAQFASYTEAVPEQEPPWYYITANAASTGLLSASSPIPEIAAPARRALRSIWQAKPIIIIDVQLEPSCFDIEGVAQHYFIQLGARRLYWKYYFFGELAKADLSIEDLNTSNAIGFDACDEVVPKEGRAFISQAALPMSTNPPQRFQLKDKKSFGKVLIKRLPNAGIQLVGKGRTSSGQSVLVAEIYINQ